MSFPSGHSSLAVFVALFLILHIQRQLPVHSRIGFLLKPFIQSFLAVLSFFTCLSRVTDNMHHFSDVAVGALIGAAIAVWMMHCHEKQINYSNDTRQNKSKSKQSDTEEYNTVNNTVWMYTQYNIISLMQEYSCWYRAYHKQNRMTVIIEDLFSLDAKFYRLHDHCDQLFNQRRNYSMSWNCGLCIQIIVCMHI